MPAPSLHHGHAGIDSQQTDVALELEERRVWTERLATARRENLALMHRLAEAEVAVEDAAVVQGELADARAERDELETALRGRTPRPTGLVLFMGCGDRDAGVMRAAGLPCSFTHPAPHARACIARTEESTGRHAAAVPLHAVDARPGLAGALLHAPPRRMRPMHRRLVATLAASRLLPPAAQSRCWWTCSTVSGPLPPLWPRPTSPVGCAVRCRQR